MNWKLRAGVAIVALGLGSQVAAQAVRNVLPIPLAPFKGTVAERVTDSIPDPQRPVRPPAGAPNVFLMMSDDVGFGMSSAFGGPVPTPNFERIASTGERYNRFHTTGVCSPSRAALLTGRNHHNAGVGYLEDTPTAYPSYEGRLLPSAATIAQILRLNGYNTAMFGKHHDVPRGEEESAAGPFDRWPTGLGFEYFYGFVGPETDQFHPNLVRGTSVVPDDGKPEMLDARLADDSIGWLHNQQAVASGKPFFIYYAPASTHEPHQAPPEYIARFKGKFDQGWDQVRVETWRRQIAMGIIPPDTKLTARPDGIPAWDTLTAEQKVYAAHSMEVAAGMLAYQDEQIGRVLAEMQRIGVLNNTLVALILGDNGASGEGDPRGTFNRNDQTNRVPESDEWRAANLSKLGGPESYSNYAAGWAWAMNAPLRWTKQFASMLGGIRNGMILSWPGHVARPGEICSEFGHLVDIAPTILDAAKLPVPDTVYGIKQKPMDGQSLLPSLAHCDPSHPRTQYFEIGGKAGLYKDGWFASFEDGRKPWEGVSPAGPNPPTEWTLYDLAHDFSQSTDLSKQYPDKMNAMIAQWHQEALRNHVFPLDHSFGLGRASRVAPGSSPNHYDYWGKEVSVPLTAGPNFLGRSFSVDADLDLTNPQSSGVVMAVGSRFAGWSLFLDHGRPTFTYARSTQADQVTRVEASSQLSGGKTKLRLTFDTKGIGQPADVTISSGPNTLAHGRVPATFFVAGGSGEMLDVGRDTGVTVTDYATPHGEIEGDVTHVQLNFK